MSRLQAPNWQTDPELADLVRQIGEQRTGVGPLYAMLLNSPTIAAGWLHLGTAVRHTRIDVATRELVVCYVGMLNSAEHEVQGHARNARRAGFSEEQIDGLLDWRQSVLFSDKHTAALAYAEAMTRDIRVENLVFEALRAHFDTQEIVELTATIGFYNMVSRFLVAIQIT